jgi:hypothetical protein
MWESWILCRYYEGSDGHVELVKVGEFTSKQEASDRALELYKEDSATQLVLLTGLNMVTDSRA